MVWYRKNDPDNQTTNDLIGFMDERGMSHRIRTMDGCTKTLIIGTVFTIFLKINIDKQNK